MWRTGIYPQSWTIGIIKPIYKKGGKHSAENYRGITIMNTTYRLYAMILEDKLRVETESKTILPNSQAGFRKKRSSINKLYNNKMPTRKGKEPFAFFMDLKSTFYTVDRDKLWQIMKKHSLGKKLILRIKELYKEIEN